MIAALSIVDLRFVGIGVGAGADQEVPEEGAVVGVAATGGRRIVEDCDPRKTSLAPSRQTAGGRRIFAAVGMAVRIGPVVSKANSTRPRSVASVGQPWVSRASRRLGASPRTSSGVMTRAAENASRMLRCRRSKNGSIWSVGRSLLGSIWT